MQDSIRKHRYWPIPQIKPALNCRQNQGWSIARVPQVPIKGEPTVDGHVSGLIRVTVMWGPGSWPIANKPKFMDDYIFNLIHIPTDRYLAWSFSGTRHEQRKTWPTAMSFSKRSHVNYHHQFINVISYHSIFGVYGNITIGENPLPLLLTLQTRKTHQNVANQ